jgi:hypothetical protein
VHGDGGGGGGHGGGHGGGGFGGHYGGDGAGHHHHHGGAGPSIPVGSPGRPGLRRSRQRAFFIVWLVVFFGILLSWMIPAFWH